MGAAHTKHEGEYGNATTTDILKCEVGRNYIIGNDDYSTSNSMGEDGVVHGDSINIRSHNSFITTDFAISSPSSCESLSPTNAPSASLLYREDIVEFNFPEDMINEDRVRDDSYGSGEWERSLFSTEESNSQVCMYSLSTSSPSDAVDSSLTSPMKRKERSPSLVSKINKLTRSVSVNQAGKSTNNLNSSGGSASSPRRRTIRKCKSFKHTNSFNTFEFCSTEIQYDGGRSIMDTLSAMNNGHD